jgi:hypothetical protein
MVREKQTRCAKDISDPLHVARSSLTGFLFAVNRPTDERAARTQEERIQQMRYISNPALMMVSAALALFGASANTQVAADDMTWASEVIDWTENVQNYGLYGSAEMMTEETTWWLTGPPDADQNDNG